MGDLPLIDTSVKLAKRDFATKQAILPAQLDELVEKTDSRQSSNVKNSVEH